MEVNGLTTAKLYKKGDNEMSDKLAAQREQLRTEKGNRFKSQSQTAETAQTASAGSTAATVEFSAEGIEKAQLINSEDENNKFADQRDQMEQMKEDFKVARSASSTQLYVFAVGSLGEAIHGFLGNGSALVAGQMGAFLEGTQSNVNGTVEERAINRELALQNAEYLAKNHITDPDKAEEFLKLVREAADNDILREKGYAAGSYIKGEFVADEPIHPIKPDDGLDGKSLDDEDKTLVVNAAKEFEENVAKIENKMKSAVASIPAKALDENLFNLMKMLNASSASGYRESNPYDLSYLFAGLNKRN